jgi:hypothetical protein
MREVNGFQNILIYTSMVTNAISQPIDINVRFVQM